LCCGVPSCGIVAILLEQLVEACPWNHAGTGAKDTLQIKIVKANTPDLKRKRFERNLVQETASYR
jgi:hypothetical protein